MVTFFHINNEGWWGRFGNQMFEIASTIGIALKNNTEFAFPKWNYSETFQNQLPTKLESELTDLTVFSETGFGYHPVILDPNKNYDLQGYFQSYKYFDDYRDTILGYFDFNEDIKMKLILKYGDILNGETCSIHVRVGDYVNFPNHHPIMKSQYYQSGINELKLSPGVKYLVFSDNIGHCRQMFIGDEFIFIEGNSNTEDMALMSMCKHNIIANSSFSWWGAYLNKNEGKKVIAPANWFGPAYGNADIHDRIPSTWTIV